MADTRDLRIDAERYWRRGYLVVPGVFDAAYVEGLRRAAEETERTPSRLAGDLLSNPLFEPVLLDDRILAIAGRLLGQTPVYFGDGSLSIYQPSGNIGAYHKDNVDRLDGKGPDWRGRYTLLRFGIYLQDHRHKSGGLIVLVGSHRGVAKTRLREVLREEVVWPLMGRARYLGLRVGDVVVWNLRTTHAGMGRYFRPCPIFPITKRNSRHLPEFVKSAPMTEKRMALFFTMGVRGPNLERYIAGLKTRAYQVDIWKNSPYGEAVRADCRGKLIEIIDMHGEILADLSAGKVVGQHRKWMPLPY